MSETLRVESAARDFPIWNGRNWFILNGHGRSLLQLQRTGFKIADVISVGVCQQYPLVLRYEIRVLNFDQHNLKSS